MDSLNQLNIAASCCWGQWTASHEHHSRRDSQQWQEYEPTSHVDKIAWRAQPFLLLITSVVLV